MHPNILSDLARLDNSTNASRRPAPAGSCDRPAGSTGGPIRGCRSSPGCGTGRAGAASRLRATASGRRSCRRRCRCCRSSPGTRFGSPVQRARRPPVPEGQCRRPLRLRPFARRLRPLRRAGPGDTYPVGTVGTVAHVVPHCGAIRARRGRVDVVTEELGRQVVLRRAARVARVPAVDLGERTDCSAAHIGVHHHADERPRVRGSFRAVLERLGERVVHEPHVGAVRGDCGCRVVAAIAGELDRIRDRTTNRPRSSTC